MYTTSSGSERLGQRPLKIGYVWHYEAAEISPVSATALHIQAVVRGFQRRGHTVRMVTVRNDRTHFSDNLETWQPVYLSESEQGVSAFRLLERFIRGVQSRLHLPFVRFFDSYRFSQAVATALADCDVLYERFWLLAYGGLMAARRLNIPLIYEVNGDLVEEYTQLGISLSRSQWKAIHFVTRQMFQHAGRVVTVSDTLRQRTIDRWGLDNSQVETVPNGADVSLFANPDQDEVHRLSQHYGLNGGPLIIFVGSFKPWHGLDLLVDAFGRLAGKDQEAKLVLVGDGPTRAELESHVRQLNLAGRVVFTGAVPHPEVARLLNLAQVAVLNPRLSPASLSQSPLKLFEYMAAGKAIVAPAIPNIQQVLEDRETALLVPPDQPESLACALLELLQDHHLRTALGHSAKQKALKNHSWDQTVASLEAIFNQELAKERR